MTSVHVFHVFLMNITSLFSGCGTQIRGMVKKYVRAKRVNNCPRISCGKVGNYATTAKIDALAAFPFLNVPSHVSCYTT